MNLSLKKQTNSPTCKSSKSSKTFPDSKDFSRVRNRQVLQPENRNSKSSKTNLKVLQVLLRQLNSCKSHKLFNLVLNMFSSKFYKFHQFYRGIVGGVFLWVLSRSISLHGCMRIIEMKHWKREKHTSFSVMKIKRVQVTTILQLQFIDW